MKTALIYGAAGQDGRILSEKLLSRGFRVVGVQRGGVFVRADASSATSVVGTGLDLGSESAHRALLDAYTPELAFYLAAVHAGSQQGDTALRPGDVLEVGLVAPVALLEAVRRGGLETRIFLAGSSHVFSGSGVTPQNEDTPPAPTSLYGLAKMGCWHAARLYREEHGVRACCGILYHHDSEYRRSGFVATDIIDQALAIARGEASRLVVGDPDAVVDWGYAGDHMEAAVQMTTAAFLRDYVIATGEARRVWDFIGAVERATGLDLRPLVEIRPALVRRSIGTQLVGDAARLRGDLGWRPVVGLGDIARRMVEARAGVRAN